MNQSVAVAERVEGQLVETSTASDIMLNESTMHRLEMMAKRMSESRITVPKHLQGNEGDCLAIIMQAVQWGMNPFVVSQKTHVVNGTLGYEAQLVNAVVQSSGMIDGGFHYEYQGEGEGLQCRVGAVLKGQGEVTWGEWLMMSEVKVRNSPLWKTNPKQQMGYLQVKNWSRLYCPGAILGVYTVDELRDSTQPEREVGPGAQTSSLNAMVSKPAQQVVDEPEDAELVVDAGAGDEEPAAEPVTFAMVADAIRGASTVEELSEVGAGVVPEFLCEGDNGRFREELQALYQGRKQQLNHEVNF